MSEQIQIEMRTIDLEFYRGMRVRLSGPPDRIDEILQAVVTFAMDKDNSSLGRDKTVEAVVENNPNYDFSVNPELGQTGYNSGLTSAQQDRIEETIAKKLTDMREDLDQIDPAYTSKETWRGISISGPTPLVEGLLGLLQQEEETEALVLEHLCTT